MKITIEGNAVLADGKQIGTYDPASNTLLCPERISPRLYTPIAAALGRKPQYDFAPANKPVAGMVSEETSERVTRTPHETPATAPDHEDAEGAASATTAAVTPVVAAPASPSLVEPPQDPMFGDKTPAWARWLRDTDPEAFEKRFAGRKLILD